jgi:hypothetical protein
MPDTPTSDPASVPPAQILDAAITPAPVSTNGKIQVPEAVANTPLARDDSAVADGGSDGGDGVGGAEPEGDGAPAARERREAIIYFPGLRRDPGVESIEAVAHRVALAMDNNDPGATYCEATGETAVFGADRARKATVVRKKTDGTEAGVLDIYEFDYRGPLVDSFGTRSALYQAWQVFATMAANTRNFIAAVTRRGQSIPQKLQVLYGGMLLSTMLVYVAFVLLTAALTAEQAVFKLAFGSDSVRVVDVAAPAPAAPALAVGARSRDAFTAKPRAARPTDGEKALTRANTAIGDFLSPVTSGIRWLGEIVWGLLVPIGLAIGAGAKAVANWLAEAWEIAKVHRDTLQAAVVSITVLGLGFRFNLKDALARTAGTTACVGSYLAYGRGRPEIVGMMARLLEHLRADSEVEYTRLHVVGYSFGSVVAIDCIYQDSEVSAAFDDILTLTTIGCPADFIRTYWRDYFVSRHTTQCGVRWLNVYSPDDVLASNFKDGRVCGIGAHHDAATSEETGRVNGITLCPGTAKRLLPTEDEGAIREQTAPGDGLAHESAGLKPVAVRKGDGETHVIPNAHMMYGHPASRSASGWMWFILAGNGFKAHRCYWADGISNAKTCWEPLVIRVCNPAAVPHPPIRHAAGATTHAARPAATRKTAVATAG